MEYWLIDELGFSGDGAMATVWLTPLALVSVWMVTALVIHLRKHRLPPA